MLSGMRVVVWVLAVFRGFVHRKVNVETGGGELAMRVCVEWKKLFG